MTDSHRIPDRVEIRFDLHHALATRADGGFNIGPEFADALARVIAIANAYAEGLLVPAPGAPVPPAPTAGYLFVPLDALRTMPITLDDGGDHSLRMPMVVPMPTLRDDTHPHDAWQAGFIAGHKQGATS